jgi:hypothetical protein
LQELHEHLLQLERSMMLPCSVQHVLKLHELVQELTHLVLLILERASQQDLLELLAVVLLRAQQVVMQLLVQRV